MDPYGIPSISHNEEHGTTISVRLEQDHRAVKQVTRPVGVQIVRRSPNTLVGIEIMHMIKKRQMRVEAGEEDLTTAEQFYSVAA